MGHNISAATAKQVTSEVDKAIAAIFSNYGLSKPKISTTYGDYLKIAIQATVDTPDENGVNTTSREALAYERYAETYGLNKGLLGTEFISNGKAFTFTGIATNRPKFPICAVEVGTGRPYKMGEAVAKKINEAGGKA